MGNSHRTCRMNLCFPTMRPMKTRRVWFLPIAQEKRVLKMLLMMSLQNQKLIILILGQTTLLPLKKNSFLPRELSSNQELRSTSFNSPYLLKLCRGRVLNSRVLPRFKELEKFQTKYWVKIHRFMDHKPSTWVPTNLNR